MPLSRDQVQSAINLVAADADCRKIIHHPGRPEDETQLLMSILVGGFVHWRILEAMGAAGWVRNALAAVACDQHTYQKLMCGGITAVTVAAIEKRKQSVANLKEVEGAAREPGGWAHFATLLRMNDNTEYVLDWHKTLNIQDPWVSKHKDWKVAKNEGAFHNFQGFDDIAELDANQRVLVGRWTVQVSKWTWIYDFDEEGGVRWTDPMNGMTGTGKWTWRDYASKLDIQWDRTVSHDSWRLPLNTMGSKGTCHLSDGAYPLFAVKK